jgi:hypothetical protein
VFAIAVALASQAGRQQGSLTDSTLVEVFRSLSRTSDGLEHLRARVGTDTMDIVLFLRACGVTEASAAAIRLCEYVLATAPALAGWTVTQCAPVEIPR